MKTVTLATAFAGLLVLPAAAVPVVTTISETGALTSDDGVGLIEFDVEDIPAHVTARSYSYAGGTLADGTVIGAGGFDPILSLFDAGTGALVGFDNDGVDVPEDPETGADFDALFEQGLPIDPGSYVLAVTQYDNFPAGDTLAEGFDEAGEPNFTSVFGCDAGTFCDFTGASRSPSYAVDVTIAPVPLPAAAWLLGAALAGLTLMRRRA